MELRVLAVAVSVLSVANASYGGRVISRRVFEG